MTLRCSPDILFLVREQNCSEQLRPQKTRDSPTDFCPSSCSAAAAAAASSASWTSSSISAHDCLHREVKVWKFRLPIVLANTALVDRLACTRVRLRRAEVSASAKSYCSAQKKAAAGQTVTADQSRILRKKNNNLLRTWSCIGILFAAAAAEAESSTCTVRCCTTRTWDNECHRHSQLLQLVRRGYLDLRFLRDEIAFRDFLKTELCLNLRCAEEGEGIRQIDLDVRLRPRREQAEEELERRTAERGGVRNPQPRGDDDGGDADQGSC